MTVAVNKRPLNQQPADALTETQCSAVVTALVAAHSRVQRAHEAFRQHTGEIIDGHVLDSHGWCRCGVQPKATPDEHAAHVAEMLVESRVLHQQRIGETVKERDALLDGLVAHATEQWHDVDTCLVCEAVQKVDTRREQILALRTRRRRLLALMDAIMLGRWVDRPHAQRRLNAVLLALGETRHDLDLLMSTQQGWRG